MADNVSNKPGYSCDAVFILYRFDVYPALICVVEVCLKQALDRIQRV